MTAISKKLRQQIYREANYRCEYCLASVRITGMPLVIDHIKPQSLGGDNTRNNLAASCYRCNEFKGAKTTSVDPETGDRVILFNPRIHTWQEHFTWKNGGTHISGLTAIGRVTVITLHLNNEEAIEARKIWIAWNWHPPEN